MSARDVTVLLPARNAASTVVEAIESVRADLPAGEGTLVVIDDASTDATPHLLAKMAAREPRLRVLAGPGRGIAPALEVGRAQVSTRFLARMDADDIWLPGRLDAQLRAMEEDPRLAAVGGEVVLFGNVEAGAGMQRYIAWLNGNHLPAEIERERYVESPLVHPATLLRTRALTEVGGYREGPFPEDYDLWLRLLAHGWKLANVPQPVLRWRDSPSRLTRSHPHYSAGAHRALKVEHLLGEPWIGQPLLIAGAGRTGLPLGRALRARGATISQWVEVHPRKIGTRIDDTPVIGYSDLGPPGGRRLLVAVGIPEARQQVREFLAVRAWVEGRDFTCVA